MEKIKDVSIFEFIRFVFVGGFCFILNIVLLYLCVDFCQFNYLLSLIVIWPVVSSIGFFLNKTLTFRKEFNRISVPLFTYNFLSVLSFLTVLFLMYILVSKMGVNYIVANIIVSFIMMFVNYLSHKKVTFR